MSGSSLLISRSKQVGGGTHVSSLHVAEPQSVSVLQCAPSAHRASHVAPPQSALDSSRSRTPSLHDGAQRSEMHASLAQSASLVHRVLSAHGAQGSPQSTSLSP